MEKKTPIYKFSEKEWGRTDQSKISVKVNGKYNREFIANCLIFSLLTEKRYCYILDFNQFCMNFKINHWMILKLPLISHFTCNTFHLIYFDGVDHMGRCSRDKDLLAQIQSGKWAPRYGLHRTCFLATFKQNLNLVTWIHDITWEKILSSYSLTSNRNVAFSFILIGSNKP